MRLNGDALERDREYLVARSRYAPQVLFSVMRSLAGEAEVLAFLCEDSRDHDGTAWRALWMTPTRLVHASVSSALDDWNLYTSSTEAEAASHPQVNSRTVWLEDVVGVAVTDVQEEPAPGGRLVHQAYAVQTVHGDDVPLPLFGGMAFGRLAGPTDEFVQTLLKHLDARR